jgi:uncharacterized membrane protein
MWGLLILGALAFPVAAIVALILTIATRDQLRSLELRLIRMERRLSAATPAAIPAAPGPEPTAPSEPEPVTPPATLEPAVIPREHRPTPVLPPTVSLEERFGTQWVVWVGGIAIALGGFFLVRYSWEQGLLGPAVQVGLGGILAATLIGVGEWARRTERLSGLTGLPQANIPSILTAAGTAVAYADIYAAYALYDFLAPVTAFVLLGLVALATLAAALLHGPALAGLGMVGGYMTPLIVATGRPDYLALYLYLAVVTASAFALARLRMWQWLAVTALAFSFMWGLVGIGDTRVDWLMPHLIHVAAGFTLAAMLVVAGLLYGPAANTGRVDGLSWGAPAVYLIAATLMVIAARHDPAALTAFALLTAATIAIAWRTDAASAAVLAAAVLTSLVFAEWAINTNILHLVAPSGPVAGAVPEPPRAEYTWHLILGASFAAMFGVVGWLAQKRSSGTNVLVLWSSSATVAPIAIMGALYYRFAGFDRSIPFAAVALALAALLAYATEDLVKRSPRPGLAASSAIFAVGSVAALALGLTMALEKGWLTVGLALMVPGIAWISLYRPLPMLRALAAIIAALLLARIAWDPRIVGQAVGTTPIFNWLLYGYGMPAASFWLAGHLLRRRGDDAASRTIDAAAILFSALLAFLEIRHLMNEGEIRRTNTDLGELALQITVWLAMAIGLERMRLRTNSIVHNVAAGSLAAIALFAILLGLGYSKNPALTGQPVGGPVFNLILLGYAVPAFLTAVLAQLTRTLRPFPYATVAAVVAIGLALGYLTLEVTRLFHGPALTFGPITAAEQYAYSSVWLVFGVALLAAGIWVQSQPVRICSAAVVVLTVLKVFLIDMDDLTGIYQALSFLGLGFVLMGIGWFYQRLLFPRRPRPS